jgi:hypothetical protein
MLAILPCAVAKGDAGVIVGTWRSSPVWGGCRASPIGASTAGGTGSREGASASIRVASAPWLVTAAGGRRRG